MNLPWMFKIDHTANILVGVSASRKMSQRIGARSVCESRAVSVVEMVAEFYIDFARIVPVESAKRHAIVQFDAAVRYVDGVHGGGESLAEIFAERHIERGVLRQVRSGVGLTGKGIGETGTVVNVGRSVRTPRQGEIAADIERVALVMVERAPCQVRKIGQPAIDESSGTRHLVGICKVNLGPVRNARRAQGQLPASHNGPLNGEREEEIGLADVVVIEKIRRVRAKHIGVDDPAAPRNVHAEFFLFVPLATKGYESQTIVARKLQQWPRGGAQRRSLIVVAVRRAEGPVETGNIERNAEARADRAFRHAAREVSRAQASGQR